MGQNSHILPTNPITCWEWFHWNPTTMPFRCDLMPYDPTPMPACPAWTLEFVNHRLPNVTWEALFLLIGYYGRLQVISIILSMYLTCIIIGRKLPKLSMYGILSTYIWLTFVVHVGKYTWILWDCIIGGFLALLQTFYPFWLFKLHQDSMSFGKSSASPVWLPCIGFHAVSPRR